MALPLVLTSSNLLETWPRGVGTAEPEDRGIRDGKLLINVFGSKARVVLVYCLKIGQEQIYTRKYRCTQLAAK